MSSLDEKALIDMIARNMQAEFITRTYTVNSMFIPKSSSNSSKEKLMPGKYNTFNVDDLPNELKELMDRQQEEIEQKLAIPKELYEKQYQQDQLDSFRQALELERERQERNDPVKRELRELRNDVEHLKDGMRKIGILLDTDLPDEEVFEQFKGLRKAYGKYKMVEKLTIGENE